MALHVFRDVSLMKAPLNRSLYEKIALFSKNYILTQDPS